MRTAVLESPTRVAVLDLSELRKGSATPPAARLTPSAIVGRDSGSGANHHAANMERTHCGGGTRRRHPHRGMPAAASPHHAPSPPLKCWMCEGVCTSIGWVGMPIQLRPDDAVSRDDNEGEDRQWHLSPSDTSTSRSKWRPLTHMTLCRRCTSGLGMPPGAPLLDVIHACNSTHIARTRSHTFVAFLREYRILLELIALEFEETANVRAPLSEANMGAENALQVAEQLLGCIEDTMREDSVLVSSKSNATHTHQHRRQRIAAGGGGSPAAVRAGSGGGVGSEWLLSVTERALLLHEGKHQRGIVAILTKRRALSLMDGVRQHRNLQHRNLLTHANSVGDVQLAAPPPQHQGGGVAERPSLATAVHRGKDRSARGDGRGGRSAGHSTVANDGTGTYYPMAHGSTVMATTPASSPLHNDSFTPRGGREAQLLRFFSDSSAPLPEDFFELGSVNSSVGSVGGVDGAGSAESTTSDSAPHRRMQDRQQERIVEGVVPAGPSNAMPMDNRGEKDVSHGRQNTTNTTALMRVEAEMETLRRAHDSQRNAWGHERMSMMAERDALRAKVETLQNAAQLTARQHERHRAEMEAAANGMSRSIELQRSIAVRFAVWMHVSADRCCELQWKKTELLGVESRAVVMTLTARQERERRHEDTARMDDERTQQYMRLVAQARRELLLQRSPLSKGGRDVSGEGNGGASSSPSKPSAPSPPPLAELRSDHNQQQPPMRPPPFSGDHRGEISLF